MSKYLTYLPSKEQLKAEIDRQKEIFYMQHPTLSKKMIKVLYIINILLVTKQPIRHFYMYNS